MSPTITAIDDPILMQGGLSVDDRGSVSFVNDFDFAGIRRHYVIENHRPGFVRAWHAHKKEAKYLTVVAGSFLIGAVRVDDWKNPSPTLEPKRYILSAQKPSVLHIPAGYANGLMSLTEGARLMIFSTVSLDNSVGDDFRFSARLWDIWRVEER